MSATDDRSAAVTTRHAAAGAPDLADIADVLRHGTLELDGRLVDSSNNALVGEVTLGPVTMRCVYKPVRGERPLWDFPEGTLARREVAASVVSRAAGWDCVPVTVFRDGMFGPGMVQQWIADADPDRAADVFPSDAVPAGWLPVLSAEDAAGNPMVLAHADSEPLAVLAAFDLVVNNADRKASHILPRDGGAVLGVDHGVTFHPQPKLRTILWGWAGSALSSAALGGIERLAAVPRGLLRADLGSLLSTAEIDAMFRRVEALLADPVYPMPPDDRTPIPWPPL